MYYEGPPKDSPLTEIGNTTELNTTQLREITEEIPVEIFTQCGEEVTQQVLGGTGALEVLTTTKGITFIPETGSIVIPEGCPVPTDELYLTLLETPWAELARGPLAPDNLLALDLKPVALHAPKVSAFEIDEEAVLSVRNLRKDSTLELSIENPESITEEEQAQLNRAKGLLVSAMANGRLQKEVSVPMKGTKDVVVKEPISAFTLPNGKKVEGTYDETGKYRLECNGKPYDLTNKDILFLADNFFTGGPQSGETQSGIQALETDAGRSLGIEFEAVPVPNQKEDELKQKLAKMLPGRQGVLDHFFVRGSRKGTALNRAEYHVKKRSGDAAALKTTREIPYLDPEGNLNVREIFAKRLLRPQVISEGLIVLKDEADDSSDRIILVRNDMGVWEASDHLTTRQAKVLDPENN